MLQSNLWKANQPFSKTKTGIVFDKITNDYVNTYEYKYTVSLATTLRRLNTVPSMTINKLTVVVVSDNCKVESLSYANGSNFISKVYYLNTGLV